MFVESMSFEELRKELDRDKGYFMNKIIHHSNKVMKQMRQTKQTSYNKYFDYLSPRKNRWVYHFKATSNRKEDFIINNYLYYMTKRSYAAMTYMVRIDQGIYYTSHFFTRYFERLAHERDAVHEIIRMFLIENESVVVQRIKDMGNGVHQIFAQLTTGVGLGYLHEKINFVEMRTFITNDMLKKDQLELSKQLEEKFKMHVVREKPEE